MEIRQLRESDAESVIEVSRLSWEWTYQSIYSHEFIESWIREKYAKHAISDQITQSASGRNGIFLGAFQNNKLIGFIHAVVNDFEAEIARLYFLPGFTRRGFGSELLKTAEERLCSRGVRRIRLYVQKQNNIGIVFYRKHGYSDAGYCDDDIEMVKNFQDRRGI